MVTKKKFFIGISLWLCIVGTAFSQVTTATLSGTVTDKAGPVPGLVVTAFYTPTGVEFNGVTDLYGGYELYGLIPGGPYSVIVRGVGYNTLTMQQVMLTLADNNVLNLTVQEETIGLEEIVITARNIDHMSSQYAGSVTNIDSRQIGLVPNATHSLNDVLSLTPQATTTSDGLSIAGGNYRQSNVTVDGAVFNNAFGIGQNLPSGGSPISLEAIDQLSISITPYDVRQNGFIGGAIQATTKSGTNIWHASAYDYFQHRDLQGRKMGKRDILGNYPPDLQLTDMLRNTLGFSVGGPIVRNKLFFYLNAEYDIDRAPGQSRKASTDGIARGQFNRPTGSELTDIRNFLIHKYDYDPGRYDGYSFNTPDWKLFARLDWNINAINRLTLRYSYTSNQTMSYPSSSVAPFGNTTLYNRYLYGRASPYGMYFENTCYIQQLNFSSLAAEWNTRLLEGRATNSLRATWSLQNEPRSHYGRQFPTVDILRPLSDGTQAVFTTFGIDPFTYGNLRRVHSVSLSDEFSYRINRHTFTVGAMIDYTHATNGFMQMGSGYYLYSSWEDFANDRSPLAFALTHSNRTDLRQQYAEISSMHAGVYMQDEVKLAKRFNFSYGLRIDVPFYMQLHNENRAFTEIFASTTGWRTNDKPRTYVDFSPRVGFNWDILGNRRLILRGGSGLFTGMLPMVWLVSTVANSNTIQTQVMRYDANGLDMHFHDNVNDMLTELYHGSFQQQDLPAPQSPTILAKDLRMPSTWKTSLALDYIAPGDVHLSVEAIYSRDINPIIVGKGGMVCHENGLVMSDGIDVRNYYTDAGLGTNPYIIHNASKGGYYASVTAKIEKNWLTGLSLSAAYTFARSKTLSDGLGDQVSSAFSFNTYSINGSMEPDMGHSSFVSPNRLLVNVSYIIDEGKHANTALSLYYEGSHIGSVLENSFTRWTPTMSTNVTGEGGSNNVIYIPTELELEKMTFVSDNNRNEFNQFIRNHRELNRHRGEYAERGCMVMPWRNLLNFKLVQSFHWYAQNQTKHTIEAGWDVHNVLNLFHREWGNFMCVDNTDILKWEDGVYTFDPVGGAGEETPSSSPLSTWSMSVSLKYWF